MFYLSYHLTYVCSTYGTICPKIVHVERGEIRDYVHTIDPVRSLAKLCVLEDVHGVAWRGVAWRGVAKKEGRIVRVDGCHYTLDEMA